MFSLILRSPQSSNLVLEAPTLLVACKHRTRIANISRMAEQMAESGAEVVGSVVVEF